MPVLLLRRHKVTLGCRNGSIALALFSGSAVECGMRKAGLMIMMIVLQACATPSKGVRPLRLHELATAPYQEVITAALAGSLTYEGNCLLFRDDQTRGYLMPVWPIGSTFNGTA